MIREIDKDFNDSDFTYHQVKRNGDVALYSQTSRETNTLTSYEVIVIKTKKIQGFILNSDKYKDYDEYESYPSAAQFGSCGWSFSGKNKLENAELAYSNLCAHNDIKK